MDEHRTYRTGSAGDRIGHLVRELRYRYAATRALRKTGKVRDKVRAVRFILTGVLRWP